MTAPVETARAKPSASAPGGVLGIVRAESAEPVLTFAVARRMAYRTRLGWVIGLVLVGIIVQVVTMSVLLGVPFLVAAVVMSWVVGFDSRLDRRGLPRDPAWENAPIESVAEIVERDDAMTRWDRSATDISNGTGFGVWFGTAFGVLVVSALTAVNVGATPGAIVAVDGAALLLLQWFSGMRSVQRRPGLVLKAGHLRDVLPPLRALVDGVGGRLQAQLQMTGTAGNRAPDDVRVAVTFPAPKGSVLTVQGQVVLNRVQGVPNPYLYAVVVGTPGQGLLDRGRAMKLPPDVIREVKHEKGMDLVIVRQHTTKTSGYRTSVTVSRQILEAAIRLAAAKG
ncbi:MAG: hypothetical protein K8T90_07215 [Planctomycetes bacterium]|nr:hypothetical protein [Planctomycetota bacterium]